ncbi:MAG: transporter substrate-binding domain-containing protein [Rhodobacteraceae bacterium]|nr:transporter substrate-binding domain-containing protein [Paracoccaceae bacterium]
MKFAYLIEPPFNDVDAEGAVIGCDVDLARAVLSDIGEAGFEPIQTEFAELLPGLADRRWRMTCGLFATKARRQSAVFSRPIWALPDGLLTRSEDIATFTGYRSLIAHPGARLAGVRNQEQALTAIALGLPKPRVLTFETYDEAAEAVRNGRAAAFASVAKAHQGYLSRRPDPALSIQTAPSAEKAPAFGCFAFALDDVALRDGVDRALTARLGGAEHRLMMRGYGFSDAEIDLITS